MIKKMLMNWLMPMLLDALTSALQSLSAKTENTVDDKLVATIIAERENIITEIKNL